MFFTFFKFWNDTKSHNASQIMLLNQTIKQINAWHSSPLKFLGKNVGVSCFHQILLPNKIRLLTSGRHELLVLGGGKIPDLRKLQDIWTCSRSLIIWKRQWSTSLAANKVGTIYCIVEGKLCIVSNRRKNHYLYSHASVLFSTTGSYLHGIR